jgi:protein-disulfide isomerase/uncharacterized membrane protein
MLNRQQIFFLLFVFLGFIAMAWSANDWYELMRGERMNASFCTLNSYWNCDRASMSALGSIGTFPVGLFGAAWFWTIGILAFGATRLKKFYKPLLVSGLMVAASLGIYLFWFLKTGCLVCYFTYFCILMASFFGWRNPRDWMTEKLTLSLIFGGIAALMIFGLSNSYRMEKIVSEEEFQKWFQSMIPQPVPEVSPLSKGNPKAKIMIAEFSDFGCPFCEKAASILTPFFATQEDVRILFFPFPLDSECNPKVQRVVHAHSCDWARAAICAGKQNQFWPFHDRIFKLASERGNLPSVDSVIGEFSVDANALKECMATPETASTLKQMVDVANSLEVQSTPTLFIAGRKIEGFVGIPYLKRLLLEIRRL